MTVGQAALLAQKEEMQADYHDLQHEVLHKGKKGENFESQVWQAVDRGLQDPSIKGSFFIVVLLRKETVMQNVVRLQYLYRQTCPTPGYDQTVFKYDRPGDHLEFIWSIPNNVTVEQMDRHPEQFPDDQQELVNFARSFRSGSLDKKAQQLNEKIDLGCQPKNKIVK